MADIPILGPIINRIVGTRNERFVKKYTQRVNAINSIEDKTRALTDEQIRGKVHEFRARLDKGEKADDLMVEAFAVAREAMDRAVGIRQIFNPKRNFDPALLPERLRETYARLRAEADAKAPAEPIGPFQGCSDAVPGYMQIEIPNEIYEAVRELYPESRPPFRARPFDVQLIGGMVLTQGKIAEMKTGEGKTIVAPLATYLAVIQRMKVHVVTVNDYLVQRDRDWTFPYFWALGLTVGAIHPIHMQPEDVKRIMYRCDVVYGTTAEFGFDYLRDNMKRRAEEQVQRRRNFAIVDEVDSILIDEARTPLIISGSAHDDQPRYELADRIARHLVEKQRPWQTADDRVSDCKKKIKGYEGEIRQTRDRGRIPEFERLIKELKADLPRLEAERTKHVQYYEVAMERKQSHLTHDGIAEAQRVAGLGSFYVEQNMDLPHLVEQALRAHVVYTRDKDYVVMQVPDQATGRVQPGVVIVDVNTGRPMVGRQWSDGLHQAVECKEKVPIKQETQTVATITIQNFFKMYKRLAGMTGTADTEAQEFNDIYKLDVVAIPTNRAVTRRDFQDMVFLGERDKWNWIVDEIKAFHDVGRPILVGTTSVEKSEMLSKMLTQKYGVQHEVLNAKQHEREANIVEDAGQLGAVMIATNMAGRGTDIKLGAITREKLLDHWLRRGIAPRTVTVESTVEQLREGVYRKVAPAELGIPKREAEEMPFADLELKLLRHWAGKSTWLDDKAIDRMKADELRAELDKSGRFLLHNLRWYESIEDLGGLHVIGTERHEARRIDNQLRGRSGRQGDKGSTRFFVSFEDDLMKLFGGESQMRLMSRFGMKEGDAIEHPWVSSAIERAQRKVEERNFQIRKTVLEYDEVMEYQRQTFYGLRQRVLEGRDVKGLLLDWIGRAVRDAIEEYTDPDYAAICAAEFAKARLDTSVPHERLKGRDRVEMEMAIRTEAKADARTNIDVTLGEYIPLEGSEIAVDFDSAGLISWARSKFGVELNPQEIREGGAEERAHVKRMLIQAAEDKIDSTDLDGLDEFVDGEYGLKRLSAWAKDKLTIAVSLDELKRARKNAELPEDDEDTTPLEQRDDAKLNLQQIIMKRARQLYRLREIEYPVDFAMDMTMQLMRVNPSDAANQLVAWANQRYNLGLDVQTLIKTPPSKVREMLKAASEKFVDSKLLEQALNEAGACKNDTELDAWLQKRFGRSLPDTARYLEGEEREQMVRSQVENILRAELLMFERTILLEVLDSLWKDHLYSTDQLRDSISFRAFSQLDPRIEFKREASRLFKSAMQSMRDRVIDYIFKAKISPSFAPPPPAVPTPRATPNLPGQPPAGAPAARSFGSSITGPGLA